MQTMREMRMRYVELDPQMMCLPASELRDFIDGLCVVRWSEEANTFIVDYTKPWIDG